MVFEWRSTLRTSHGHNTLLACFRFRANKKAKLLNGGGAATTVAGSCVQNVGADNYQQQNYNNSNGQHYQHDRHLYSQQQQQHYQQHQQQVIYGSSAEDHYEMQQAQYNYSCSSVASSQGLGGARPGGPNLVNKQLVLPFVPPSFPNNSQDGVTHLIKPSEYLKSISDKRSCTSSARSTDTEDYMQIQVSNQHPIGLEPPKPPPPPPLPVPPPMMNNDKLHATKSMNAHGPTNHDTATRKQHQPLSAISIQDLNSVQLRRTDTQKVPKPFQMPARSLSMQCLSSTTETYLKTDLIAELKISKDIPGIKKMKVEKQMACRFDSEQYSEISKQFTANNYVEQIPEKDQAGNIIPDWKRQMMAKKAAERAKKEFEERLAQEAENRRLSQIPQWKRDLLARREETENKLKSTIYTPKVEENNRITETWRLKNRAVSIDNINTMAFTTEMQNNGNNSDELYNNKENNIDNTMAQQNDEKQAMSNVEQQTAQQKPQQQQQQQVQQQHDDNDNIIPWRAQLRKTNSRLSLI